MRTTNRSQIHAKVGYCLRTPRLNSSLPQLPGLFFTILQFRLARNILKLLNDLGTKKLQMLSWRNCFTRAGWSHNKWRWKVCLRKKSERERLKRCSFCAVCVLAELFCCSFLAIPVEKMWVAKKKWVYRERKRVSFVFAAVAIFHGESFLRKNEYSTIFYK